MKVWVNGSFDVLHIGHIRLLDFAAKFGKVRVGIDCDKRILSAKGENRPYNTLQDRMDFVLAIKHIDSVVSFCSDDELRDRIREWQPDLMVIGSDYRNKPIIGSELVNRIEFFERIPNKSTTLILGYENISHRGILHG
jgi:D-beta-D-heptose 7-phosphate kinase/D-beta-D-heptose 1-phosphate adenosyltransferase